MIDACCTIVTLHVHDAFPLQIVGLDIYSVFEALCTVVYWESEVVWKYCWCTGISMAEPEVEILLHFVDSNSTGRKNYKKGSTSVPAKCNQVF